MTSKYPLVSIIIPVKNSAELLDDCLISIKNQSYPSVEVILVDSGSSDKSRYIAGKYGYKLIQYKPNVAKGYFEAPYKRNYGVSIARGTYIYYLDVDMRLPKEAISEAVNQCQKGSEAVILSEESYGNGIWARAKNLERRCYWGDDTIEAPRFFTKKVWDTLGGLDTSIGGGGDDWDLFQKLKDKGFKYSRVKSIVLHFEGDLSLKSLWKKRYMYGRQTMNYVTKRPKAGFISYFPFRKAYFKNWKHFLLRPVDAFAFFIMRFVEYTAGLCGIINSIIFKK